jgi:ribosome recycling factor
MTPEEIIETAEQKMQKAVEVLQEELRTIRTGRPNPDIFRRVRVECYGTSMALQDVATISVPDGRSFAIQPFDKSNLQAIEHAIQSSDLGLTPNNDGNVLRIHVPPLSEDRRKELRKQVNKLAEEKGYVVIRNIRREANDQLKKLKAEVSEDDLKRHYDRVDKITSTYNAKVEELIAKKDNELAQV